MQQIHNSLITHMKNNIDKNNMRQVILDFPKQFRVGLEAAKRAKISKVQYPISNIIICGMGGSALPGDILKMVNDDLTLTKLPILIHRNYGLPTSANRNSLIVCISYSGNTEETISAFKEARKEKIVVATIASGGKLIEFSKKYKIPFSQIPSGIQPRAALGYQFSALFETLSSFKLVKNLDEKILQLEKILKPEELESRGRTLAKTLKGKIPLIYASQKNQYLARIWKIKFNENSKIPAFYNFFPELNHNEMTGIGECKNQNLRKLFKIIILSDKKDHPQILKRMKILTQIFKEKDIETLFVEIRGRTIFEKIFRSILIADWASYWLAIFQGIDPTPVQLVEEFKKRMK